MGHGAFISQAEMVQSQSSMICRGFAARINPYPSKRMRMRVEVSHPCDKKKSQGWGTGNRCNEDRAFPQRTFVGEAEAILRLEGEHNLSEDAPCRGAGGEDAAGECGGAIEVRRANGAI